MKYILQHLLDGTYTVNKYMEDDIAFVPVNDKCMTENLLKTNVFRTDKLIQHNLALLFRNLFSKTSLFDKTLDMIDRLFEEIDDIAKKNEEEENLFGWIILRKVHLFS